MEDKYKELKKQSSELYFYATKLINDCKKDYSDLETKINDIKKIIGENK